jgi:hypothetical protein
MSELSIEHLRKMWRYDPETGLFHWRVARQRITPGQPVGVVFRKGYTVVEFEGRSVPAHRLAWFYVTGRWPAHEIDHVNRVRADNRWANLREATKAQNMANSVTRASSGVRGVCLTRAGRWKAQITVGGKTRHIGTYDDVESAKLAYACAAVEAFGRYANIDL